MQTFMEIKTLLILILGGGWKVIPSEPFMRVMVLPNPLRLTWELYVSGNVGIFTTLRASFSMQGLSVLCVMVAVCRETGKAEEGDREGMTFSK